jgi:hypothetical protein
MFFSTQGHKTLSLRLANKLKEVLMQLLSELLLRATLFTDIASFFERTLPFFIFSRAFTKRGWEFSSHATSTLLKGML